MKDLRIKFVLILLFSLFVFNLPVSTPVISSTSSISDPINNIAVIFDSPDFYHESYFTNIREGLLYTQNFFEFNISYYYMDYFNDWGNYSLNNTSDKVGNFIDSQNITDTNDLIVLAGFYLSLDINMDLRDNTSESCSVPTCPPIYYRYPDTKFLIYDIKQFSPASSSINVNDTYVHNVTNVAWVKFSQSEVGFLAGAIAAANIDSLTSVSMVGTFRPKDFKATVTFGSMNENFAGFQAGLLYYGDVTKVDHINIDYLGFNTDRERATNLGSDLKLSGTDLLFATSYYNNTLGLIDGFSGPNKKMITIDSDLTDDPSGIVVDSIISNSSSVFYYLFNLFNSTGFASGIFEFGILDNAIYPATMSQNTEIANLYYRIQEDLLEENVVVPNRIAVAQNTPGFSFFSILVSLIPLSLFLLRRSKR